MQIIIHRGTREVGGSCVEIGTGTTRIILDIGMPLFRSDRTPHDTSVLRRMSREELRQAGILPDVEGLFDGGPAPDAILLSHAHEDHTGLIRHSREGIPVYASVGTSKMMDAGSRFAGQPYLPAARFREIRPGNPVQIGDFQVTGFSVDHSIYGSLAFLIECGGKTVFYSGDLRLHGRKPGMHRTLVESLSGTRIDVLLMEGTHIGNPDFRGPSEYDLEEEIVRHIESASGLVLASFSPQHVDRLVAFLRGAKRTGRIFVADAYAAYVMHLIHSEVSVPPPEMTDWVRVFYPAYFEESYGKKRLEKFYFLMSPARIGIEEIRRQPSRFLMIFRPSMLQSDFDAVLPEGTRCLYSRWTGYLDRPEWEAVHEALAAVQGDLIEVHTSGHLFANDISEFVQSLDPGTVVPIHTFDGSHFARQFRNVRLLEDGEAYPLE